MRRANVLRALRQRLCPYRSSLDVRSVLSALPHRRDSLRRTPRAHRAPARLLAFVANFVSQGWVMLLPRSSIRPSRLCPSDCSEAGVFHFQMDGCLEAVVYSLPALYALAQNVPIHSPRNTEAPPSRKCDQGEPEYEVISFCHESPFSLRLWAVRDSKPLNIWPVCRFRPMKCSDDITCLCSKLLYWKTSVHNIVWFHRQKRG